MSETVWATTESGCEFVKQDFGFCVRKNKGEPYESQWENNEILRSGIEWEISKNLKGFGFSEPEKLARKAVLQVKGGQVYFDDKSKFVSSLLAEDIMDDIFFKTMKDDGSIYAYFNGVYKLVGENLIREAVVKRLGENFKVHYANEVIAVIQGLTFVERETANSKNVLNLQNGLFNLETSELTPHTPDYFSIIQLPIFFSLTADCQKIKKFLSEVLKEEDISVAQEIAGYCLHNKYEIQKAAMFIGEGANGKSTFLNIIKTFLGSENISSVSLKDLDEDRFATASLFGKMANIYPDLPDSSLYKTGKFKMLTGGDAIPAQKKFGQRFHFTNSAKLLFSCNKVPESNDRTNAFFRRWIFLNFPNKFEGTNADKNLLNKLTTPEELSGLFNWALEGLQRLLTKGDFTNSKTTEDLQDHYERLSSPIAAFVKDCIETGDPYNIASSKTVLKTDLYQSFVEYCQEKSLPACANNIFGKGLPRYLPSIRAGKTKQHSKTSENEPCWYGIEAKE